MTRRDLDPHLLAWFDDGPIAMPDRVLDAVAERIERQPQRPRRAWRLRGRSFMNTYVRLAGAAAAAVLVAIVGYNLLPRQSGPGGGGSSPTPVDPTSSPTVAPTANPLADGGLPPGRYRVPLDFVEPGLSVEADIPSGWVGHPEAIALTTDEGSNAGILVTWMEVDGLFKDPCRWDLDGTGSTSQAGDVEVGPTAADMVAALKANSSYASTAPEPVTIGGFDGQGLELQLPGEDVISTCDRREGQSSGDYFVFPRGFYAQSSNSRWHLYILDLDATRLITLISIPEGAPPADVAAAEAIVASFEFSR